MRVKVIVNNNAKVPAFKKNFGADTDLRSFTALQLRSMQRKKLGFPVHLGQL